MAFCYQSYNTYDSVAQALCYSIGNDSGIQDILFKKIKNAFNKTHSENHHNLYPDSC